ncbi:MAG: ion channel [Bacteroidota bacterium]
MLALIQHLFVGIFLNDLAFYTRVIWPINMVILGVASFGVFMEQGRWKIILRNILFVLIVALPISLPFMGHLPYFMPFLGFIYGCYFVFVFWEIIRFLIKPSYINIDIISAAGCGFFLLIEIMVFVLQIMYYSNPESINGIDPFNPASIYIDLVYLSSIVQTTIGFGDITPNSPQTKLIVSLFGILGQFYSVVLVGILLSKFTSKGSSPQENA